MHCLSISYGSTTAAIKICLKLLTFFSRVLKLSLVQTSVIMIMYWYVFKKYKAHLLCKICRFVYEFVKRKITATIFFTHLLIDLVTTLLFLRQSPTPIYFQAFPVVFKI